MRRRIHTTGATRWSLRAALFAALLGLLVACSDSTDPGGGGGDEVDISFTPQAATVGMIVGEALDFAVTVKGAASSRFAWTVDGFAAGAGATYTFAAVAERVDTVAVNVVADGVTRDRKWIVTVSADPRLLPPVVSGVEIGDGPLPVEVTVHWLRVTATQAPIAEYLIAMSYDGPVTALTWSDATLLATVPHTAATPLHNEVTLTAADGLQAGAQAWFAVRARDADGKLSPINQEFPHTITYPWNLEVLVRGDDGRPLSNVILYHFLGDVSLGEPGLTAADGRATLGPFRNVDAVTVQTRAPIPFIDFVAEPVGVDGGVLELVLIESYFLDHVPCGPADPSDFLAFLQHVTVTDQVSGAPKGHRLYRWEEYPLSVWIQPPVLPHELGWDLAALAADALPRWNDALQDEYLYAVADSASADIVIAFDLNLDPLYNGVAEVLVPGGDLGEAVPEKMRVRIDHGLGTDSPSPQEIWVTEVTMHELGHVLGLYRHICLGSVGNLMDNGGAIGALAPGGNGICEDEWHAVRAIRHIPQGTDMSKYNPSAAR